MRAAASSSSVDLPMPGSPASSTTAPGTRPPPSTRSSSPTPVVLAAATSALTWPIGIAGAVVAPAWTPCAPPRAHSSSTVPRAWHSPHRPTHLVVRHPHPAKRYRSFCAVWALSSRVAVGTDNIPSPQGLGAERVDAEDRGQRVHENTVGDCLVAGQGRQVVALLEVADLGRARGEGEGDAQVFRRGVVVEAGAGQGPAVDG